MWETVSRGMEWFCFWEGGGLAWCEEERWRRLFDRGEKWKLIFLGYELIVGIFENI